MRTFTEFSEEVSKITLQYHRHLNSKLWSNNRLDSLVRAKLLQIARAWQQFAKIENNNVFDIILTGGNANYNYTRQSDIDVHLVVDYKRITCEEELVMDYFMAKKSLWASTHSKIRVKGHPVELFAEDKNASHPSGQGVYSLLKSKWIQEPQMLKLNFKNDSHLKQKVDFYMKEIDRMVDGKQDVDTANALKDKIRTMRGAALQQGGEFSFENLVFKELRNRGYLDKLSNYVKANKEKELSLA